MTMQLPWWAVRHQPVRNIAVDNSVIRVGGDTTITAATNGDRCNCTEHQRNSRSYKHQRRYCICKTPLNRKEFNVTSTAVNTGNITATTAMGLIASVEMGTLISKRNSETEGGSNQS